MGRRRSRSMPGTRGADTPIVRATPRNGVPASARRGVARPGRRALLELARLEIGPQLAALLRGADQLGDDANGLTRIEVADAQNRQPEALDLRVARRREAGGRGVAVRVCQPGGHGLACV